jgi:phosphopantetheinyl transferase (holo-ACP synthase)
VNAVSGAGVNAAMIANRNAIKEALAKAIHEKMLAKTRKVVGNQTLHKSIIDNKMSLGEQLKQAEKDRKE